MTPDEHIAQLERDGALLASAAEQAGWDAPVPATEWDVRALVTHVGGIHRWAAGIVRDCAQTTRTELAGAVGTGPADDELLAWFVEGHRALVETLRAAPADLDCVTFLPNPSPRAFWARRQAHETAIHRSDAQAAALVTSPSPQRQIRHDPGFAQDGIAEMLLGFAARPANAIARPGVLALRAEDGPHWRVELGGECIVAVPDQAPDAHATVTGTSSDIYLWLWNRPSDAVVSGDESLAGAWRTVRVRWN
jgi:uncharacterized protein (TIGR03083 family)